MKERKGDGKTKEKEIYKFIMLVFNNVVFEVELLLLDTVDRIAGDSVVVRIVVVAVDRLDTAGVVVAADTVEDLAEWYHMEKRLRMDSMLVVQLRNQHFPKL